MINQLLILVFFFVPLDFSWDARPAIEEIVGYKLIMMTSPTGENPRVVTLGDLKPSSSGRIEVTLEVDNELYRYFAVKAFNEFGEGNTSDLKVMGRPYDVVSGFQCRAELTGTKVEDIIDPFGITWRARVEECKLLADKCLVFAEKVTNQLAACEARPTPKPTPTPKITPTPKPTHTPRPSPTPKVTPTPRVR